MERETLTIAETAKLLGISLKSAYRAAEKGAIPTIRIGGRILVLKAILEHMLEGKQREQIPDNA